MAGRPIDEKIVAMKMDNSDFKRKAMETTGLFGKLKQSLANIPSMNLGKVTSDLNGISKAANGVDLGGMARSIDQISSRFSTLGVVATTALVNITNQAMATGQQMIKSLTTDQIMDGFREYETKMGSIQTILANTQSKGSTLADVKRNFEELNRYADKTIYSFADMTKNIGLFTNAGLGLDESTKMIKGFSNAAAASGAGSMEAARAAYQLSQGLSSGYIMAIDWMSLTNAGMGNDNMKRDLVAIGQAMGTLGKGTKNTEKVMKNWKETLSDDKWLTADVMSMYLQTMAGEMDKATLMSKGLTAAQADLMIQNAKTGEDAATKVRTFTQMMSALKEGIGSGWAESFEIIFGDFEQATKLWSSISNFITPFFAKQAEARNATLRAIFNREGGGLGDFFKGITNILKPIGQLFGSIGDGFRKAFPKPSVSVLSRMVEGFAKFTESLAFSAPTVKNLETIFAGFFSVFAIGWKIIKGAASVIIALIPSFEGVAAKVVELIAKVAKIPLGFNKATDSTSAFKSALEVVKKVADVVGKGLESVIGGIILFADAIGMAWAILAKGDFKGGPWEEDSAIVDKLFTIRETVVEVVGAIKEAWSILTKGDFTGKGPWEEDSKAVDWLFRIREALQALGKTISNFEFASVVAVLGKGFDKLVAGFDWLVEKLKGIGQSIKNALPSGQEVFAGGFIAGMIGIVGMAMKMAWDLYQVFTGWGKIGDGVTEVLEGVGGALESFSLQVKANALLTIAFAIGVLAAGFWIISGLNGQQIANGLYMIIGSLTALIGAMMIMDKYDITGTGMKTAVQIVALSIAFSILAGALRKVADLKWGEITKGLYGLGGTMLIFSKAVQTMTRFGGARVAASAGQLIALAGSVYILSLVLKKIGDMPFETISKGLFGLVISLGIFAGAVTLMSKFGSGQIAASSFQFLAIAGSILIIVEAIRQIARIPVEDLKVGLTTIGYILAAISLFGVITKNSNVLGMGAGILLLAVALNLLVAPIALLGHMDLKTLAIGIGAMAIALAAIGAASMLMTGMVAAGAGLILVAAALHLLIVPITVLGNLPWQVLVGGIVALAAGILLIGGAATLLGLAAPALMLGAAGIALLGVALLAAGAGIALFSTSLVTLAAMTGSAVVTIVAFLGTLIVGLTSLIPSAVNFVWEIMQKMAEAFRKHAPVLAQTMYEGILAVLKVIADNIPKFVEAGTKIITNFLDAMAENLPKIVDSASKLMVAFIESLAAAVERDGPKFQAAVMSLMAEILIIVVQTGAAVIQALFGWIPGVEDATNKIGESAEKTIRDAFDAAGAAKDKGKDFSSTLASKSGDAKAAGSKVGKSAKDGADSVDLKSIGSGHGADFASGIASKMAVSKTQGYNLAKGGKDGASTVQMSGVGLNFGQGFAGGIGGAYNSVVSAAKSLAKSAAKAVRDWLDINSPSRVMRTDGGWFGQGFAMGIADKAKMVGEKAKNLALTAKDSLNKFLDGFELPEEDNELHFKAVVDYDQLDTRKFGSLAPMSVRPDTSTTSGLVAATKADFRQNGYRVPTESVDKSVTNNNKYDIHVTANGTMSKPAIRKLAEDIQDAMKDLNDRARMSRGEEVAF